MRKFFLIILFLALLPNFVLAKVPNDPQVKQWAFNDIGAYEAWDYAVGSRQVVVAIIDNGFDTFQPDLLDNAWKNEKEISDNNIDDDNNGYIDDIWGWNFVDNNNNPRAEVEGMTLQQKKEIVYNHATLVAGLIGAVGDNGEAGAGLNWQVRLMNLKVLDNTGESSLGMTKVAEAIHYAVDNGADIINISLVGGVEDEIKQAVYYAYQKNVAVVAAVGNDLQLLDKRQVYPVCVDAGEKEQWVLGVSAIDEAHHLAFFSNIGSDCVDITAPGVHIYSTLRFSPTNGLVEKFGGSFSGTSFATPLVSGALALIKSVHPEWGAQKLYQAILNNVHHTPGQDEKNYANLFGKGLLQVNKALEYAISQPFYNKLATHLSAVDLASGRLLDKNLSNQKLQIIKFADWRLADDMAHFVDVDKKEYFAVVRAKDKKNREVVVYNNEGNIQKRWSFSASGPVNILVGDLTNTKRLELVIFPNYADKNLYRIYNLDGKELYRRDLKNKHDGVSANLVYDYSSDKDQLALLYRDNKQLQVQILNEDFDLASKFNVDFKKRGVIGAGDLNGDGKKEVVVTGGNGEVVQTKLFEDNGALLREFVGYISDKNKLSMAVGDFNHDGQAEFALGESQEGINIWQGNLKKELEWEVGIKELKILTY